MVSVRTDIADLTDPEMRGSGSAFHIGDGVYVTAAHVVDGGTMAAAAAETREDVAVDILRTVVVNNN